MSNRQRFEDAYDDNDEVLPSGAPPGKSSIFGRGNTPPPQIVERIVEVEVPVEVPTPIVADDNIDGFWIGHFGITKFGVVIKNADEQEWEDFCATLLKLESAGEWVKADWCYYGVDVLNKSYADVAMLANLTEESAEVYASIGRNADKLIRINSPSFSHFRLVINKDRDEQLKWMQDAVRGKWTVSVLRDKLGTVPSLPKGRNVSEKRLKQAVREQKRFVKAVVTKSTKLPDQERQEMAQFLREQAERLERGE